jgi:small subunit ribosomal protein S17
METVKKIYRRFTGVVVSNKMDKTAVVVVERTPLHKKYKKQYKVSTRYKVHDSKNICQVGDRILFQECRPLSKEKKWRFVEKVK